MLQAHVRVLAYAVFSIFNKKQQKVSKCGVFLSQIYEKKSIKTF